MTSDLQLPAVGARINLASSLGTVKFVGQIDGTKGIWLGVEWDNPERGKHSGNKDGKQYFTCRVPGSASFIRPSSSISLGRSFLQALLLKYVEIPIEPSIEKVILGSSNGAIEVEAVGMNKVRSQLSRLERLREVSLDMENVAYADDPGEIQLRCPNIQGLDLSRSLLPSWKAVARITSELSLLGTLSLNFNRLQLLSSNDIGLALNHVRELRLNGTFLSWEDVLFLLPSVPELRRLELGLNDLQDLTVPWLPSVAVVSSKVDTLNLQENRLSNWQSMMGSLAIFKHLDRLILSDNKVESIPPPSSPSSNLQQMKHLTLASNRVRSWSAIDALSAWFPELHSLNISFNPIVQDTSSRSLIIARLSTLMFLNASAISPAERRDSEIFYLSFIVKNCPSSEEKRERDYPRYRELCEKHGRPEERKDVPADTLKNRLIETHFFRLSRPLPPIDDSLPTPEFALRVLPSMTLRVLRLKVLKTLRVSTKTTLLMWLALERGTLREFSELSMELANRPIEWWGVDDKSKIAYYVH